MRRIQALAHKPIPDDVSFLDERSGLAHLDEVIRDVLGERPLYRLPLLAQFSESCFTESRLSMGARGMADLRRGTLGRCAIRVAGTAVASHDVMRCGRAVH
ncbi:MAG: hypothetical protein M0Z49_16895 [Chloroflexi bacterium]|nr:hypothetical protein [Chloroflexota bacterium]